MSTNLNKPGSGKQLLKQVTLHHGIPIRNETRKHQLAQYKSRQQSPKNPNA